MLRTLKSFSLRSYVLFSFVVAGIILAIDWYVKTTRGIDTSLSEPALQLIGAGGFYALIELIDNRDRFTTDPRLKTAQRTSDGTINGYLNGRLRKHGDEDKVFVELAGEAEIKPDFSINDDPQRQPMENIAQAMQDFKDTGFVLVGDPGAGKSTALRDLERHFIQQHKADPELARWPLWINLGLADNEIEADLLLEQWRGQHYLPGEVQQYINQHALWLLLDGLNEMPLDTRKQRAESLQALLKRHPVPAIITCRVDDYTQDSDLHFDGLPVVRIHELNDDQIAAFIHKRGADDLLAKIPMEDDHALRRMARNPYKLVMLIAVYKATGALPADLNSLYERYVELAYDEYTAKRAERGNTPLLALSWPQLERKLKTLALRMITIGNGVSLSVDEARRTVGNRALLDGISMSLLKRDGDQMQFHHQSLQGYFAVEFLSIYLGPENPLLDRLELIKHIGDLGENGSPAFGALIRCLHDEEMVVCHAAIWALGEIGDKRAIEPLTDIVFNTNLRFKNTLTGRLASLLFRKRVKQLKSILGTGNEGVRSASVRILGKIGNNSLSETLIIFLKDEHHYVRAAAAEALLETKDERALGPLVSALHDKSEDVRFLAAMALANIADETAKEALNAALFDDNKYVRAAAGGVLAKMGDDRVVEPMINLLAHEDRRLRSMAIVALCELEGIQSSGLKSEWVLDLLKESLKDKDWLVRSISVAYISKVFTNRAVVPLVVTLNDEDERVREYAAEALEKINTAEARAALEEYRKR